ILGKSGAREHDIAAGLVGLLLELALDVRQVADHADALVVGAALEFGDQTERVDALEIKIEDDQARFRLRLAEYFVFIFNELNGHARPLGRIVNLYREKQVTHNGEDLLITLLMHTVRLQKHSFCKTSS